jgi:hypothetical protein
MNLEYQLKSVAATGDGLRRCFQKDVHYHHRANITDIFAINDLAGGSNPASIFHMLAGCRSIKCL